MRQTTTLSVKTRLILKLAGGILVLFMGLLGYCTSATAQSLDQGDYKITLLELQEDTHQITVEPWYLDAKNLLLPDYEYWYTARVISVYDGDTFTARAYLGFGVEIVQQFRLSRADTPELKGAEREEGIAVRDYVISLILDQSVVLRTENDKEGKYGRPLSEVLFLLDGEPVNLSNHLIATGRADFY